MTKDKALEELFLAQKPSFDDGDVFMAALDKRLDAVEFLVQYQVKKKRQYRYCMIAALLIGFVFGCGMMVFAFALQPAPAAMIHVQADVFRLLSDNARIIAITILSLLVSGSVVVLFNILVDIMGMKMVMRNLNWK